VFWVSGINKYRIANAANATAARNRKPAVIASAEIPAMIANSLFPHV
jgi:hypothetical protein